VNQSSRISRRTSIFYAAWLKSFGEDLTAFSSVTAAFARGILGLVGLCRVVVKGFHSYQVRWCIGTGSWRAATAPQYQPGTPLPPLKAQFTFEYTLPHFHLTKYHSHMRLIVPAARIPLSVQWETNSDRNLLKSFSSMNTWLWAISRSESARFSLIGCDTIPLQRTNFRGSLGKPIRSRTVVAPLFKCRSCNCL
jgi:hypothetical protein